MSCASCAKTIASGATGLAKVALRVKLADSSEIQCRRDHCRKCSFATRNASRIDRPTAGLTTLSRCLKCSCFIVAKTQVLSEKCPLGQW